VLLADKCLQPAAPILFVSLHDVTPSDRGRIVLLAPEVPVKAVPEDLKPTGVLERLQVGTDLVVVGGG
jgi:hypothetical protein